jgi:hypothetical protein
MNMPLPRRPGDQILDRIAPHLSGPERDFARERLEQFAGLLVRIAIRQVREEHAARTPGAAIDSPEFGPEGRMGTHPPT